MEVEGGATEPRLDALDALRGRSLDNAVRALAVAQTSKTLKGFAR